MLITLTPAGLHDFLMGTVIPRHTRLSGRVLDLGAGSGKLASELDRAGFDVLAADLNDEAYHASLPFVKLDLNEAHFATQLGDRTFDVITAVEVIEHLESPIVFLRNIRDLLCSTGVAIITTPNIDCTPARLKFLLTGSLRMMDTRGEPTHISPVFWDLFTRQWLPLAGVHWIAHYTYPEHSYQLTRPGYRMILHIISRALRGRALFGDNHVFVLKRSA
jgi:2-polyprenyl-3-methyl-5-hydroxy-6-metoxy-1,4-benzoquinol methylase